MKKTCTLLLQALIIVLAACDDYVLVKQELSKQTKLMNAAAWTVKNAESPQAILAALKGFNDEMEILHSDLAVHLNSNSNLKNIISSPPRHLAKETNELKKASQTLRETLAAASMHCEDAHLRKMLVKTVTTLDKTLAQ